MNCRKAQRLLSARRDGECARSAEGRLAEHVASCSACREFEAALAVVDERLACWDVPAPRAGFPGRLMARLADQPRQASLWEELLAVLRPAQLAVAAATLAVGVFLANSLFDDAATASAQSVAAQSASEETPDALYSESFGLASADSIAGTYLSLLQEREN